ncbi:MAG: divalent-cation tolerance protein CutA [Pseudomonadota bacterium]|nr:divalent-cation tolerance protein CutA [Pseudomonadota bacterium]
MLTACNSVEEADAIAASLLERRLAACVNRLKGVISMYRWKGKVRRDQETLLLIKTTEDRFEAMEQAIRKQHSYELPEILAVHIQDGSQSFLDWLIGEVQDV